MQKQENEQKSESVKACFAMKKSTLDTIRDLSKTLGVPQSEILNRAIENPESIKIYKDAAEQMKKLGK